MIMLEGELLDLLGRCIPVCHQSRNMILKSFLFSLPSLMITLPPRYKDPFITPSYLFSKPSNPFIWFKI